MFVAFVCLSWDFTAYSTYKGHVKNGQLTYLHCTWAGLVL